MSEYQVLPYHILEKQTCTNCFQYLSVLPVNQNRKGEIYCGRCKADFEETGHIPMTLLSGVVCNSMFNEVAKQCLFKCVNHYEGCKKMLDVNSSEKHEKECCYQPHQCFFCSCRGNWCQIVNHCLKDHSNNVTHNGLFQFELGIKFAKKLVFIVTSNIFLVSIEITEEKFSLIISPEIIDDFMINQFAVEFFASLDQTNSHTIFTDYSLFDINTINYFEKNSEDLITRFGRGTKISCQIMLKQVKLSKKELELEQRFINFNLREKDLLKRERLIGKLELELAGRNRSLKSLLNLIKKLLPTYFTCIKCKKTGSESIYHCPQNHCYCENCLSNTCHTCNKICEFSNAKELNKILVTCDWPNCVMSVSLRNYLDHKSNCLLRPYKCPLKECPATVYSSQKLISHWHCQVPPLITVKSVQYNSYNEYEFYWFLNNDLFHVIAKFFADNFYIIVEETLVLPHNWKFKIEAYSDYNEMWELLSGSTLCEKYIVASDCLDIFKCSYTKIRINALNS